MKQSHPCLYNYTPPPKEKAEANGSTSSSSGKKATPKSGKNLVSTASDASKTDITDSVIEEVKPVALAETEEIGSDDKKEVVSAMEVDQALIATEGVSAQPAENSNKSEAKAENASAKADSIASTTTAVAPESATKKRKRIQPQVVGGLGCVTLANSQFSPDKRPLVTSSSAVPSVSSASKSNGVSATPMEPVAFDGFDHNTNPPLMETPAHTMQHAVQDAQAPVSNGLTGIAGDGSSVPSSAKKKRIQPILVSPLKTT